MRVLLAFVVVGLLAVPAAAQETVTVVASLPQQQRQGSFQTSTYTVPADATGDLRIRMSINAADYENTANTMQFRIYVLFDQVWRVYVSRGWSGGRIDDPEFGVNPDPFISTSLNLIRGRQIRGEIDLPNRMRVGCTVEVVLP